MFRTVFDRLKHSSAYAKLKKTKAEELALQKKEFELGKLNRYTDAFDRYDGSSTGRLDIVAIRKVFQEVNIKPTTASLYLLSQEFEATVDDRINLQQFLSIFDNERLGTYLEKDTIDAFVALGGNRGTQILLLTVTN